MTIVCVANAIKKKKKKIILNYERIRWLNHGGVAQGRGKGGEEDDLPTIYIYMHKLQLCL